MNNKPVLTPPTHKHQSGIVLVISLVMLLALTMIGVTSSSVTGMEEKMAANNKDINLAFQAAEATLRDVEASVGKSLPGFPNPTSGLYDETVTPAAYFNNFITNSNTNYTVYTGTTKLDNVAQAPRYIIEMIKSEAAAGANASLEVTSEPTSGKTVWLRITARGWGSNTSTVVTVQSIVKVTYG